MSKTQRVMHFTVPGIPVAQPRPQVGKRGVYYPGKAIKPYKAAIVTAWQALPKPYGAIMHGPVCVSCVFWFPRPAAMTWKTKPMLTVPKITRPDLDNLLKGVLDSLQHKAFDDDSCVIELRGTKLIARAGIEPRTDITISGVGGEWVTE